MQFSRFLVFFRVFRVSSSSPRDACRLATQSVLFEGQRHSPVRSHECAKFRCSAEMRLKGLDGTRLAIDARMFRRSLPLLLLIAVTSCVGGIVPVKVRPGSNIALPEQTSLVGEIVGSVLCTKGKTPQNRAQCGQARIDSIPQRRDTLPTPPAKRP